jgi:hypothetical protein
MMISDTQRIFFCCECEDCFGIHQVSEFEYKVNCAADVCSFEEVNTASGVDDAALSLRVLLTVGSGVKVKGYGY